MNDWHISVILFMLWCIMAMLTLAYIEYRVTNWWRNRDKRRVIK
jgi:hypothetical protein